MPAPAQTTRSCASLFDELNRLWCWLARKDSNLRSPDPESVYRNQAREPPFERVAGLSRPPNRGESGANPEMSLRPIPKTERVCCPIWTIAILPRGAGSLNSGPDLRGASVGGEPTGEDGRRTPRVGSATQSPGRSDSRSPRAVGGGVRCLWRAREDLAARHDLHRREARTGDQLPELVSEEPTGDAAGP
jgi:hypothetical protein